MKKIAFVLIILAAATSGFAQTDIGAKEESKQIQTLFGNEASNGGYGALMFNYSNINDENAFLFGVRGGWIIDHKLTLGFGGYGFANDMDWEYPDQEPNNFLTGGYGGFLIEPILFARKPVHLSFPILIGAGGVALVDDYYWDDDYYDDWYAEFADAFFVIEPGVEVELNLIKAMRLAFAVTYRFTEDVELGGKVDKNVLNGFNFGMALKFGKF
jgi:hypothetical protein